MKKRKGLDCILLIDDDEVNNYLNTTLIEKTEIDVRVEVTVNGSMALEYLTSKGRYNHHKTFPKPDLILLDINMPGMNGWEFLDEYYQLDENWKENIIIAMLTSSNNVDDVKMAFHSYGIQEYIYKPLTIPKIEEIIYKYFPNEDK